MTAKSPKVRSHIAQSIILAMNLLDGAENEQEQMDALLLKSALLQLLVDVKKENA